MHYWRLASFLYHQPDISSTDSDTYSYLIFIAVAMVRSSFAISEKAGLLAGSVDQHFSISDLHAGSHQAGVSGRRVPFIIPAENER